jgi:hypothetical protein
MKGEIYLNILVVHKSPFLRRNQLTSVQDAELILKRVEKSHKLFFWNYKLPSSIKMQNYPWDIIVITSSVLSDAHTPLTYSRLRTHLKFLEKSNSFKVVLPQDEYYCPENLEELFTNWRINYLVTLDYDQHKKFYPKISIDSSIKFKQGYTFYNSEHYKQINDQNFYKNLKDRPFDIVYRAHKPIYANNFAEQKYNIGEKLETIIRMNRKILRTNITGNIITGSNWPAFLSNSKTVIGSSSGSNLILRNIEIIEKTRKFIKQQNRQPNSTELADMGVDTNDYGNFTVISPRNMEAAAAGTIQILVKGEYSKFLVPGVDYIETNSEFTNLEYINDCLSNIELLDSIRHSAWQNLNSKTELRFENLWADILLSYQTEWLNNSSIIDENRVNVTALKILNVLKIEMYAREKLKRYVRFKLHSSSMNEFKGLI